MSEEYTETDYLTISEYLEELESEGNSEYCRIVEYLYRYSQTNMYFKFNLNPHNNKVVLFSRDQEGTIVFTFSFNEPKIYFTHGLNTACLNGDLISIKKALETLETLNKLWMELIIHYE